LADLEDRSWLVVHFTEDVADTYYDENLEKDLTLHPSCTPPEEREDDQVSLSKCIGLFTATEQLGEDDLWYCNKCKEHVQATKKFDLWKMPSILVIHLKRFSYKNKYWRDKLETFVDYPGAAPEDVLDLSAWAKGKQENPPVYELYAVSVTIFTTKF
jgi:ubiquitin C-terminal hydrolase